MFFGRKEGTGWHIYKGVDRPNKFYDYQVYPKMPMNYEEGYVYQVENNELFCIRKKGSDKIESL